MMHPGHDQIGSATRPTRAEAARFLLQATLGPTRAEIDHVCAVGFARWIDEQFETPASLTHPEAFQQRLAGQHFEMHHAWWRQVLTGKDLLRQRVAFALIQVFVVSEVAMEFVPWEMLEYYDDLARLAFGNWRDLLKLVSTDPLMGYYLSHLRNRKADPALQRFPDENFAREVMQLFSIGLWELEEDGTRKRDAEGREIPTYDNTIVTAFARVFTGLAYGGETADLAKPDDFQNAPMNFSAAMGMWEHEHDRDEKRLLRGTRIPAFADDPGRTAWDDIEDALDNLFFHPNVGPFFGRLLIQRLVKSNPSPAYIRRVAEAFKNNGRAVRGDMRAVLKAILLDPEARAPGTEPVAGMLREPYLRYVQLARGCGARSEAGTYRVNDHDTEPALSQVLLRSPSVFNFFLPDYQPPGEIAAAGACAPEFQVLTSSTAITSLNHYARVISEGFGDAATGPDTLQLDLTEEQALADRPAELLAHLNVKLAAGTLSAATQQILLTAWSELPASYPAEQKIKALLHLIVISPDFAVAT